MNGLVKNVFLLIMGCIAAVVLYVLLFGSVGLNGQTIEMDSASGYSDRGIMRSWKGVLWYAAEMVEVPISRYYHMYCLIPNLHVNDYVDEELGATLKANAGTYMHDTPAHLGSVVDSTVQDWSHSGPRWDTGWR